MKVALALVLSTITICALAADPDRLTRGLNCELQESELASVIHDVARQRPDFKRVAQYGAPSVDVYELSEPATAFGYSSRMIAITTGRILLAVPGATVAQAVKSLQLEMVPYAPASRTLRATVNVVALQLSHQVLAGKLLVGCEYASDHAAQWVQGSLDFEIVKVFASNSLRASFLEIAKAFESLTPSTSVLFEFGASDLLKDRLLEGERASLFASENIAHPRALLAAGRARSVVPLVHDRLCLLTRSRMPVESEKIVEWLVQPQVKVGIWAPSIDSSGSYAFELFDRIEASGLGMPGSAAHLKSTALRFFAEQKTGLPGGGHAYGKLLAEHQADFFVTYCSTAVAAMREQIGLQIVHLPARANVSVEYNASLMDEADAFGTRFAAFLLTVPAQEIFRRNGFAGP